MSDDSYTSYRYKSSPKQRGRPKFAFSKKHQVDDDEMEVKSRGRPIKQEPVEETEDDSTEEEEEAEVSPKKGAILKKVGLTKKRSSSATKNTSDTEDDSAKEEEQIEDLPKKRGRPKGSGSVKNQKGKSTKMNASREIDWEAYTSSEQYRDYYAGKDHHTNKEEDPIDINPMTGRKYYAKVKIEKGEEGKSNPKNIKKESPSNHSMQEKLDIMKRQFEKAPPQNVKQHFETLWIYILQDPLNTSPYFLAVIALLNNRSKQPSSYLRSSFLSGALQGLAAADTTTPAVERRRGCLSHCEMVTLRKIEFGENEASSHEYIGTIYNHTAVKFMVKFNPKDNNAVPEFINDILEILKSEMFFASIHQITLLGAASGPSILDMRNSESSVWQYLRNPKNMMVASMTYLNQILLDEDIVKVLKKMYNRQWQDYLYVGWNKCVTGFTNHEYPIFRKK